MRAINILDRFRLDGQVAVITGGGRAIGSAIALAVAEAGADVGVAARRRAEIEAVARDVRERGRRALAVPTDVLDGRQHEALAQAAMRELGRITLWVNNAAR